MFRSFLDHLQGALFLLVKIILQLYIILLYIIILYIYNYNITLASRNIAP